MDGSTLFALPFTCWWAFSLFLTWSLKNTADVNIGGQVYIWTPALNSLDVYLGVDIPKHNCQNMTIQFSQSCLTLCDPMDCSTPGFPIHYQLLELAQIHVHRVGDAIQPSHPVTSFCSCLQSYPASESFLFLFFFFFFFYLWWILSYIEMKQPRVYMCSPSQSPLPPPSPPIPSRLSQGTRSEHLSHASNLGWWSVSP